MTRLLKLTLFLSVCVLCNSSLAATYDLAMGTTIEAELPAKQPQVFTNFLLWKIKGYCEVSSETETTPMSFKMLANKGSLDNVEFKAGDSLYMDVINGQRFELIAEPRAKIEIVNLGTTDIKIRCSSTG